MSLPLDVSSVRGSTEPRIWTPPLRELTPETSYGFFVIDFARDVLNHPLDPWQEFAVIHAGELLEDGTPRFSVVLIIVARQNGKTEIAVVLSLFWIFLWRCALVLGTSTKLDYARESWRKAVKLARKVPDLAAEIPARGGVRETNGEQELKVLDIEGNDYRYKIAASNAEGGRSLSIDRLIMDELRQHKDYTAWDAAEPATSARIGSQIFALSNAGDDTSVVLNDKRAEAIAAIEAGDETDLCILEWSAPEDADPLDLQALAQANPNLGYRKDAKRLLSNARRAVRTGGEALTGFKTESMCIRVKKLNPAIDPGAWSRCLVPGSLDELRPRIAVCLDVAPDSQHVSLVAAAVMPDGRVRVEGIASWEGLGCTDKAARALPALLARVKPKTFGWFPAGPAAAMAATLADRRKQGRFGWPPPGVAVAEIRGETSAACMGFADLVTAEQVCHNGEPLLDDHVTGVEKLKRGDAWLFARFGEGHADAAYAAAGATQLARTMPQGDGKPRLSVVEDE